MTNISLLPSLAVYMKILSWFVMKNHMPFLHDDNEKTQLFVKVKRHRLYGVLSMVWWLCSLFWVYLQILQHKVSSVLYLNCTVCNFVLKICFKGLSQINVSMVQISKLHPKKGMICCSNDTQLSQCHLWMKRITSQWQQCLWTDHTIQTSWPHART